MSKAAFELSPAEPVHCLILAHHFQRISLICVFDGGRRLLNHSVRLISERRHETSRKRELNTGIYAQTKMTPAGTTRLLNARG